MTDLSRVLIAVALLSLVSFYGPHAQQTSDSECGDRYVGVSATISLDNGIASLFQPGSEEVKWEYELAREHHLLFLTDTNDSTRSWLLLCNQRLLFAYDQPRTNPFFRGADAPRIIQGHAFIPTAFAASSSLTEGAVTYDAANLGIPRDRQPWVEASDGWGIGEHIDIQLTHPRQGIWISIGFVSYERPELYSMNGRPRRILVEDRDSRVSKEYLLRDAPDIQYIGLESPAARIRLTILDVFEGTTWQDTAINFIVFF
jgi:hypothetical protein